MRALMRVSGLAIGQICVKVLAGEHCVVLGWATTSTGLPATLTLSS
jgi:hypothetical protein